MDKKDIMSEQYLEPRVAKLETSLEMLTRDLANLAQITREQGSNIEIQIKELAIAVTQAAAPKKTDWQMIFAALMLMMAIGSAVFWPLNQTSQNNKVALEALTENYHSHTALELHPVGKALLGRVEEQLKTHIENNRNEFKQHEASDEKEFTALDAKLQKEFGLMTDALRQKQAEIEKELTMVNDKMSRRVTEVEEMIRFQDHVDTLELRSWRNKANGLSVPTSTVPLIPRESPAIVPK